MDKINEKMLKVNKNKYLYFTIFSLGYFLRWMAGICEDVTNLQKGPDRMERIISSIHAQFESLEIQLVKASCGYLFYKNVM
jgi:hypothetical protein